MKKISIGEVHDSKYGLFTVTKLVKKDNGRNYFKIKFHSTGGESVVDSSRIRNGNVYDPFSPTTANVGYLGNATRKGNEKLHDVWRAMLHRCYAPNYPAYKDYGEKGVYVDSRWHSFENFLNDVQVLEGFSEKLYRQGKLVLDKDLRSDPNNVHYSPSTCCWITRAENALQSNKNLMRPFIAISPTGKKYEGLNLNEFARNHNLTPQRAHDVLNGKATKTKGWKFFKKK